MSRKYLRKKYLTTGLILALTIFSVFFVFLTVYLAKNNQDIKRTKAQTTTTAVYEHDWITNPNSLLDNWSVDNTCQIWDYPGGGKHIRCFTGTSPINPSSANIFPFDVQDGTPAIIKFRCQGSYNEVNPPEPGCDDGDCLTYHVEYATGYTNGELDQRLCGDGYTTHDWNLAVHLSDPREIRTIRLTSKQNSSSWLYLTGFRIEYTPVSNPTPTPTPTATPTPTPTPSPSLKPIGATCFKNSQCNTGKCGTDFDGDKFLAKGITTGTCQASNRLYTDCYDRNKNAYPGSPSFGAVHRGDGSFDYNCDGVITREYPSTCITSGLTPNVCYISTPTTGKAGFTSSVPTTCGASGTYRGCYKYRTNNCTVVNYVASSSRICGQGTALCAPIAGDNKSYRIEDKIVSQRCR